MTGPSPLRRPLKQRASRWGVAVAALLISATSALAHHLPPGYEDVDEFDQAQMTSGFLHPFTGLDHLLLAFAVGCLAFAAGKKAGMALASSFVGSMTLGMIAGRLGTSLPMLEQGLALSVIGAGLLMVFAARHLRFSGVVFAVVAGLWHGNAHGAEMSSSASALAYGSALLLGTMTLSAAGVGLMALSSRRDAALGQWVGGALAIAGAWIWIA